MCVPDKLFLMFDDEHSYGQLVSGAEPSVAVEAHYASLDAWCAPAPDAEISEEFSVFLYELPPHLTDEISQQFEDMSGHNIAAQLPQFLRENPRIAAVEINVTYTAADGATASELPVLPDLFNRSLER